MKPPHTYLEEGGFQLEVQLEVLTLKCVGHLGNKSKTVVETR